MLEAYRSEANYFIKELRGGTMSLENAQRNLDKIRQLRDNYQIALESQEKTKKQNPDITDKFILESLNQFIKMCS